MRASRSDPFKILRKLIMGMMILAFPSSITISALKGYRISSQVWGPFGYALVVSGVFFMIIGFMVFGILLFIYVEKNTNKNNCELINQTFGNDSTRKKITGIQSRRFEGRTSFIKVKSQNPLEEDNS